MKIYLSRSFLWITFLLLLKSVFFAPAFAQTSSKVYHPNPVIGLVDGKPVTFEDVRNKKVNDLSHHCLLYTSPSPRDRQKSRMPSSA